MYAHVGKKGQKLISSSSKWIRLGSSSRQRLKMQESGGDTQHRKGPRAKHRWIFWENFRAGTKQQLIRLQQ